jgi:cellulose synthase (UDP-forming)
MPVVFSVILNPRNPTFKVTPKGKSLEINFFSRLSIPFILMCSILVLALPVGIFKWFEQPLYRDVIVITLVWSLFNLCIAMAAFGAFYEKRQIRRSHRMWTKGSVLLYFPRLEKRIEAKIDDISASGIGVSFQLPVPLLPKEQIKIEARDSLGGKHLLDADMQRIMQRGETYFCGLGFVVATEEDRANVIRFVYTDSQRWVDYWGKNSVRVNSFKMIGFMLVMSLKGFRISSLACLQLIIAPAFDLLRNIRSRILTKFAPNNI